MSSPNPVEVKLDLAPVTKLIESISDAIGVVYEPTKIRRKAKADADASLILLNARLEGEEIERQAAQRLIEREARRQENRIAVAKMAAKAMPESVSEESIDQDWVTDFFEHVQDISNEQLQDLWARILAGEVAQPGSFSRRTLGAVRVLSRDEARLFGALCRLVWKIGGNLYFPLVFNEDDPVYHQLNMGLQVQLRLQSAGLTTINALTGWAVTHSDDVPMRVRYFDRAFSLVFPKIPTNLRLGYVSFSPSGLELLNVVSPAPDEQFVEYVVNHWRAEGIIVDEV